MKNKTDLKKVSIVIPSYNSEKTIKKTINSILNQTYTNFNIIIVDDCSTDNTVEIINEFSNPKIILHINETNICFENNWNKALSMANGDFIKLIPDDDTLEKDALKLQVDILNNNQNVSLVSSKRNIIDINDKILMIRGNQIGNSNICTYKTAIKYIVRSGTNPIGEPGSTMFRANILQKVGKFNGQYPHFIDLDFYIRLLEHGDYYFINKVLGSFRVWGRSYSVANQNDQYFESKSFFMNIYNQNDFITKIDLIISYINLLKLRFLKRIFYFLFNKGDK